MNDTPDILKNATSKRTCQRRHGKIGRLPPELRDFVNQSLLEGQTYPKIIKLLEDRGHKGVNAPNLAAWVKGGYQDWLRDREQATQFRARCEAVLSLFSSLPPKTRAKMGDINNFAVALQFSEILQQNEPGSVGQLINKKPENFFNLASFITTQSSEETRRRRLDLEAKKFQFKLARLDLTDRLQPKENASPIPPPPEREIKAN